MLRTTPDEYDAEVHQQQEHEDDDDDDEEEDDDWDEDRSVFYLISPVDVFQLMLVSD